MLFFVATLSLAILSVCLFVLNPKPALFFNVEIPAGEVYLNDPTIPGFKADMALQNFMKMNPNSAPITSIYGKNEPANPEVIVDYWLRRDSESFYHASQRLPVKWLFGFIIDRVDRNGQVIIAYPKRDPELCILFPGLFLICLVCWIPILFYNYL